MAECDCDDKDYSKKRKIDNEFKGKLETNKEIQTIKDFLQKERITKKLITECNLKLQKLKTKMKDSAENERDNVLLRIFEQICNDIEHTLTANYKKKALSELERFMKI